MPMRALAEAVAKALQVHGFTVTLEAPLEGRTGQVHTVPLLAEGTKALIVECSSAEVVEAEEVAALVQRVEDTGADLGILCHLGPRSSDAADATSDRVVLWGQDRLIRILGEAQLAEAVEGTPNPLPLHTSPEPDRHAPELVGRERTSGQESGPTYRDVAEPRPTYREEQRQEPEPELDAGLLGAFANAFEEPVPEKLNDILPPAFQDIAPQLPAIQPEITLPPFPPLDGSPLPPPEIGPGANPVPSPHWQIVPSAPAAPPAPPATRLLPVRVDLSAAKRTVKDRLFSITRHELILQPVHLFDYECDILGKGSLKINTVDGRIQVNGSDRKTFAVDPDQVNPLAPSLGTPPGIETAERVLRITPERAQVAALEAVMELHTRSVDVQVPDPNSSFFYVEKKRVPPRTDQIRLKPLGIYNRPVWRLIGSNGLADIDAVDGTLLHKELRNSNPDAMLIE